MCPSANTDIFIIYILDVLMLAEVYALFSTMGFFFLFLGAPSINTYISSAKKLVSFIFFTYNINSSNLHNVINLCNYAYI